MPDLWGLISIGAKWALYLGVLGASGTVICGVVFGLMKTKGLALGFAGLGLLAAALSFMIKGVALTGDASGMTDPEMLGLLWQTQSGTALRAQGAGLLILIAGLALGRIGAAVSVVGALLALSSFALVGHVPDRGGVLLQLVLLLHLVGAAFWIGILFPLRRLSLDTGKLSMVADIGERFGHIATFAVPGLIIAGVFIAYILVGSLTALISTAYGQALLLKAAGVAVLLSLAALNKLRYVPAIRRGDNAAASKLAQSITFEWAVILVILAVTAVLTSTLSVPM